MKYITKKKYDKSRDKKISFISELELANKFASIKTLNTKYLLSWHCKTCTLSIEEPLSGILLLGIDLKVIIIDINKNYYKEIGLDFFFSEVIKFSDKIYLICTELEVLILNIFTMSIEDKIQLPDIYKFCLVYKDYILIHMIDDNILRYQKRFFSCPSWYGMHTPPQPKEKHAKINH